ncbi:hypothetical protein D8674_031234 [Pyrus ussuriensis x Pyrus communis]|uniref:Uncharacterized protein n=1 Tax=Pyrus ussuriensis x Pyrus communis TaxID=2448454 RepID=A0A5N5FBA2_9ROSA|nr:hypothetical protein D8674_031234 [Pyrus ussuriensis x Pyrus communis]
MCTLLLRTGSPSFSPPRNPRSQPSSSSTSTTIASSFCSAFFIFPALSFEYLPSPVLNSESASASKSKTLASSPPLSVSPSLNSTWNFLNTSLQLSLMLKSSDRVFRALTLHELCRIRSGALVDDDSSLVPKHDLLLRS